MANHNITITATDKTGKTLKNVDKGLDKATRRALMFKGALGLAGAAIAAMGTMRVFGKVIDDMDSLAKRARNVGIQSEEGFAKFQVASRLLERGGLEVAEIDRMFRNLEGRMAKGLAGNKQYAEVMDKLGDSIFDANGELKEAPDLFAAVATAMQEGKIDIKDAQTILGEMVGPKVLGLFTDLADKGVTAGDAMAETAEGMNLISFDQAGDAEAFNDALDDLKDAFNDLLTEAISPMLPHMTKFVEDLVANAPGLLETFKAGLDKIQPVFDLIGTVLENVILPAFGLFVDALVALSEKIAPIVDDNLPAIKAGFEALQTVVSFLYNELLLPFAEFLTATLGEALTTIVEYVNSVAESFGGWEEIIIKIQEVLVAFKDKAVEIFNTIKEAVQSIDFGAIKDDVVKMKDDIVQQFTDMKDKVMEPVNKIKEGVAGAFEKLGNLLVWGSIVPDMKEDIIAEFKELGKETVLTTEQMVTNIKSDYERLSEVMESTTKKGKDAVKSNMEEAADAAGAFVDGVNKDFNDRLVDGLVDGNLSFDTFADLWKSTLKDLLKDTLNGGSLMKDIFSNFGGFGGGGGGFPSLGASLFGGGGGLGGGISSFFSGLWGGVTDFFGGLFGGFFANGGMIPAGQFGVVGEAGPELISGPARVTSNEDAFGVGNKPEVNITIQAIDTQTGTEFLLKNKKQIEGIIQNAYNRRGKQGIY